jgi:hypothetical protein
MKTALSSVAKIDLDNAEIICDFIIDEQNQINIAPSTREDKINCLVWLVEKLKNKSFVEIVKDDILSYLNSLCWYG